MSANLEFILLKGGERSPIDGEMLKDVMLNVNKIVIITKDSPIEGIYSLYTETRCYMVYGKSLEQITDAVVNLTDLKRYS